MHGSIKTSDNRDWSKGVLYPSPGFLSKNQVARNATESVAPVVIAALGPEKSLEGSSFCAIRAFCYHLDKRKVLRDNKELVFVSFKMNFNKDIFPSTISAWIQHSVVEF